MIAHGNKEVVDLMEQWTATANEGEVCFASVIQLKVTPTGQVAAAIDFAGSSAVEPPALEAIDALRRQVAANIANREPPVPDPSLGADYVSYNLAGSPVSWDFFPWLIDAEMTRIREKAPAPLKIFFLEGLDGKTATTTEYHRTMLHNVVRPLLMMVGAVEDPVAARGRHKKMYTMRDITAAVRAGEKPPRLIKSLSLPHYSHKKAPVVITLREASHWVHRNSNLPAWLQFAEHLKRRGENVIFVRDTAKVGEPLPGFETASSASLSVHARLALYEQAKCNMGIMNGPVSSLTWFGTRPWLSFVGELKEDDPYEPRRPGWWLRAHGIEDGGQLPWSRSDQRLIWKPDTYENLCEAWEEFCYFGEQQLVG